MSYGANLEHVPIFLEANDKTALVRLMILNNNMNGAKYNYMSPFKDGSSWIVWFYADVKKWKDPSNLSEDEIKAIERFR